MFLQRAHPVSYILLIVLLFQSCEVFNPAEKIPSYIHIDKFNLNTTQSSEGSNSSKITDVWAYIDDQLIGAFELPATFPVLFEGQHVITLKAGIKVDGISATRAIYPFYEAYNITTTLYPDSIITLNPVITYSTSAVFVWKEAFEDGGITIEKTLLSDTIIEKTSDTTNVFEGTYSGVIHLDASHSHFEGKSLNKFVLPGGTKPTFLELDFKTNTEVGIGLYANFSSSV
mgnify:CR=1 FL=1